MNSRLTSRILHLVTVCCLCLPSLLAPAAANAAPEVTAGQVKSVEGDSTVGDFVWRDLDVNGQWSGDGAAPHFGGMNGVVVNFYTDDGDGLFEPGGDDGTPEVSAGTQMTTTVNPDSPNNNGWYDFSATGNQSYWVEVDSSNFLPGGTLENHVYTGNLGPAGLQYKGPMPRKVDLVGTAVNWDYAKFGYALALVEMTKVANETPDGETTYVQAGDTITYTYSYTNTGDAWLQSVTITDDLGTADPADDVPVCTHSGLLAPEASGQCQYVTTLTESRLNTGTLVGNPTDSSGVDLPGEDATAADDANVVVYVPCLEISKELVDPAGGIAVVSDTITYTMRITNCGTTTVTLVPLFDYFCPACVEFLSASVDPTSTDDLLGTVYWADLLDPGVGGPDELLPDEAVSVDVSFRAAITDTMYWKEKWHDYALSGVPDFDQKQGAWGLEPAAGWQWTYCGPVAVANSLWWFDSKFEETTSPPPPDVNDTYGLVAAYGSWDDHDAQNVQPLVSELATWMDTDAVSPGTSVISLTAGIEAYLTDKGLDSDYSVTAVPAPEFAFIEDEVRRSEDVILLLGFWQDPESGPAERLGGHYVTVAGVDSANLLLALSDPFRDNAEGANAPYWSGGSGRVRPNPHAERHPSLPWPPQTSPADTLHNDSWFASHDVYTVAASPTPGGPWGLSNYALACDEISNFIGQNVGDIPNTLEACAGSLDIYTEIEYAVAVSPTSGETVPCQPVNNVAVVSGAEDEPSSEIAEVQDNAEIVIVDPAIEIAKTPDMQMVQSGGTANWTIYVTNTGNVDLTNVAITDALAPDCDNAVGTLAPDESTSYTCSLAGAAADFENVAAVSGDAPAGPPVSADDAASVDVISPEISIDKTPDVQYLLSGGTATWTIYVTNTGDVTLTSVTVTDPLAPSCVATLGTLTPDESRDYTCMRSPVTADLNNVATAVGTPPVGIMAIDEDAGYVDVIEPAISIAKTPELQYVVSGGTVTWTIEVTNTGDVTLTNVAVTDALASDCDSSIGTLDPDQSTSYTCSFSGVTADFTNVAEVTGDPPEGAAATDDDDAAVEMVEPAIAISKTPDAQLVPSGGTANWTIYVTNTGDVTLVNVAVTDALAPDCDNTISTLAPDEATSYSCALSGVSEDFQNVAAVSGDAPAGPPVTGEDAADVDMVEPEITIDKTPDLQTLPSGGTANWTIHVTNTGDVPLENVAVADLLAPDCERSLGPLDSDESTSYTCSLTNVSSGFTNIARASGDPPVGPEVTDSDNGVVVVGLPDLLIDKDTLTSAVTVGGQAQYRIVVRNVGTAPATGLVISDTLPVGFAYASGSASVTNGTRTSTTNPPAGSAAPHWGSWTVNAGGSVTINFTVDIAPSVAPGTYDNTAQARASNHSLVDDAGATGQDSDTPPGEDPEADEDVTVQPLGEPDVEVTKTLLLPADGIAVVGETVRYQVRIHNTGATDIITLPISDVFDGACLSYQSASPSPSNAVGNMLVWYDRGPLAAGNSLYVTLNFRAAAPCVAALNTACVINAVDETPSQVPGDCDAEDVTITQPGLNVVKTLLQPAGGVAEVGEDVTFRIQVFNTGNTALSTVPLDDEFFTGCLQAQSSTPPWTSATAVGFGTGTLHWNNIGPIPVGGSATVEVNFNALIDTSPTEPFEPADCEPVSNVAIVSGAQDENGDTLAADSASDDVNVIEAPGPTPTPTATPTTTPACEPDPFEIDNSCAQAQPIGVNGMVQNHNFHQVNDEDWVEFQVESGVQYTISTSNLVGAADTVLWLYDSDCTTELGFNDDYEIGSYYSQIIWTATHDGTVHAKVTDYFGRGDCGSYDISVQGGPREFKLYLPVLVWTEPVEPTPTPTRPPQALRHPLVVDVHPLTHRVYVSSRDNNSVFALNGTSLAKVGSVGVGSEPFGLAVNPNTNKVYVACYGSDNVYVLDGSTLAVLEVIHAGGQPSYVAINPDTNRIYVTLHALNGVAVIDGATDTVEKITGAGGAGVFGIAVNRALNRIYVSSRDANAIATIDGATHSVLHSQQIHLSPERSVPYELAFNEATQKLYIVYGTGAPDKVWVYNATLAGLFPAKSLGVGYGGSQGGGGIAVNASTNHIFVTNSADNSVSAIDGGTDTVVATYTTPAVDLNDPFGVIVDPVLNMVFVANRGGNSVVRFPDF